MLDTIILEIPIKFSAITDPNQFNPPARIVENLQGFFKCTNNRKAIDRKSGIYKPKLTLIKRIKMLYLKIEFSAPKMLFDNNLDEAQDSDFNELVLKIQNVVRGMGVMLWTHEIENANVIGFHPSKNIILTKGYTSSFAIRELSKINLSQKMDLERVGFRNDGESIQLYSNRHSIVFYDKINDLTKPAKRAIDKDQTKQQTNLFEFIKKEKKNIEVLRFEIRISHKDKMVEILDRIGFKERPTLKSIFKKDLCQKIVSLYWNDLFGSNLFLFNTYNNPQKILEMILMKYPKTKIRTAVMLVGLKLLCKDDAGVRGFRKIAGSYKPKTNWLTLRKYLKKFEDEFFTIPIHGFVKDIKNSIKEFEAFKLIK